MPKVFSCLAYRLLHPPQMGGAGRSTTPSKGGLTPTGLPAFRPFVAWWDVGIPIAERSPPFGPTPIGGVRTVALRLLNHHWFNSHRLNRRRGDVVATAAKSKIFHSSFSFSFLTVYQQKFSCQPPRMGHPTKNQDRTLPIPAFRQAVRRNHPAVRDCRPIPQG